MEKAAPTIDPDIPLFGVRCALGRATSGSPLDTPGPCVRSASRLVTDAGVSRWYRRLALTVGVALPIALAWVGAPEARAAKRAARAATPRG